MRATSLTLTIAAGLAFASAFAAARWGRPSNLADARDAGNHRSATIAGSSDRAKPAEETRTVAPVRPTGVFQDALLRDALASPDLIAAVKEIMAREEEDHCADTRLICLVENLPTARLAELSGLLDANFQNDFVVRFVLGAWAQRDPAGALAWVQLHPSLNGTGVHAFMLGWTRAAPDAALAWVDAQPLSAVSDRLRTAVVEAMAEDNPAAALDLMKSRGWLAQHPKAIIRVLQNWGGSDPAGALQGLRDLSAEMGLTPKPAAVQIGPSAFQDNRSFRVMLGALLHGAFQRNPEDASALLAQLTPAELALGRNAIASEVVGRDPDALKSLLALTPGEDHRALLRSLVAETPEITLAALTQVQDPALQAEILIAASSHHAPTEALQTPENLRATVMAAVSAVTDAKARGRLTSALIIGNAAQSPAWAAELWTDLPVDQQLGCGPAFLEALGTSDASTALEIFRTSSPEVQTASLKNLCYGMAGTSPTEALQLVLQQGDGPIQAASAATLFAFWVQKQPEAALGALEQNAGALDLDAVLAQLPLAGHFQEFSGSSLRQVDTAGVAGRIRELIGTQAPPPPAR